LIGHSGLPLILTLAIGLLLGLGTYTFQFAKGLAYFSNDPAACANCHIMNDHLASWQKSSHHGEATCNDCHAPAAALPKLINKADNGWNHSLKFTLQNFAEPIRIRQINFEVVEANCVRCHLDLTHELRASLGARQETRCTKCHSGVGHGPRR